jgi:Leucine-rich repeat (LRR) protein
MVLSGPQIENGFWLHDPVQSFPPTRITYPDDYDGASRLNLVCTQLDVSGYRQRKLVENWAKILPTFSNVHFLWLSSRVNQSLFEAACAMPSLEGLYIDWSGVKDIGSLLNLNNLKYLHIGSSTQVQDIECLRGMDRLVVLEIENFKKISQLEAIGDLTQLEGLAIEGSIWATQTVESLKPLARLRNLKYLFLSNLRSEDSSLEPLCDLDSLIHVRTAYWWPEEEFSRLRTSLPRLKYGSLFDEELIARFSKR